MKKILVLVLLYAAMAPVVAQNQQLSITSEGALYPDDGSPCYTVSYDNWETSSRLCQPIEGLTLDSQFRYRIEVSETKLKRKERKQYGYSTKLELVKVLDKELIIKKEGLFVRIQTSLGDIYAELYYDKAPLTVANFIGLAEGNIENTAKPQGVPYYDSLIFHRVIPNFMIQGGDPTGTGMGGPGYQFKNETSPDLKHSKPGILSMANAGPNTNGSQFFITHRATPWLDGGYNIFGEVIDGQEIVTAIGNVPRNAANKPNNPVYIKKLTIIRNGDDANAFDAAATFNQLK